MLSRQEFWIAVIAICIPALAYLLRDCVEESNKEDEFSKPWQWGDKARHNKDVAVWFPHEIGLIFVCLADLAILKVLLT
jgi:hypothetical protein